jgi:predicted ThiF/HesA family dinucleotide-utilizing enzyme
MRISEYVDNLRKDKAVMAVRVEPGDIIEDHSIINEKTGEYKPDFVQIIVIKYAKVNPSGKVKLFQKRLFVRNYNHPTEDAYEEEEGA